MTGSEKADISKLIESGKPIGFAFRYITRPQMVNGFAKQWLIQDVIVKSKDSQNNIAIAINSQAAASFRIVDEFRKMLLPARR